MPSCFRRVVCLVLVASTSFAHAFLTGTPLSPSSSSSSSSSSCSCLLPTHQQTRSLLPVLLAKKERLRHHGHRHGHGIIRRRRGAFLVDGDNGAKNVNVVLRAARTDGSMGQQEEEALKKLEGDTAETAAEVLAKAVETRKVPATEVSEALEVLAGTDTPSPTFEAADIEGTWELVFSTQLKSGYMPVYELIGFFPSREEATIDTKAGPVPIGGIRGQCRWKGGPESELDFSLTEVKLGPFKFSKGEVQVKTYKFFVNDQKIMAAKSSAGGFALFSRVS